MLGIRVDIYRNLNAKHSDEMWSIKSMESGEEYGKVVQHAGHILLSSPKPVVQQSGLDRYHETGVKNVHAFLRGSLVKTNPSNTPYNQKQIYYDGEGNFRYCEDSSIFKIGQYAIFNERGAFVA